ncbi:MAG: hypothetical protein R3F60_08635 [bacterium]
MDEGLLDLLVCPETREKLGLADAELVAKVNAAITAGSLKNRRGAPVKGPIDGGLVRPDRKVLYPVQDDIPNLLVDDAIPLDQL